MILASVPRRFAQLATALIACLLCFSAIPAASEAPGKVELLRDRWGTPHIFAANEADGFYGLGYACADDRMLQMDMVRRRAAGRLAEVFGKDWVESDRSARIAGHSRYAAAAYDRLPAEMQRWVAAYAAGVNAWLDSHRSTVERRFKPLGALPERWTPADCLLAARGILGIGWPFGTGGIDSYRRFREIAGRSGEAEALKQVFRWAIDSEAAIVSEADFARDPESYRRVKAAPRVEGAGFFTATGESPKMSQAWAVSGRKSTTGRPILESDPQLTLSTPPFFYEFHLSAGRIAARGIGLAGLPGLFIGYNRRIAWGVTSLGAGSTVTFIDRLTADGKSYQFEGREVAFERRLELIRVQGAPPVVQEVLSNRHGVVFNSLVENRAPGEAYLLYDPQTSGLGSNIRAMLGVMTASGWRELRSALEHYYEPGVHLHYADADGNVGYHTVVHTPLTARSPRMAQEGWSGQQEVRGRIPFNDLPHMLNPEQGFVSHANNLPVGAWYPYDLGIGTGGNGHTARSLRLLQLLEGDRKFSMDDLESVVHRDDRNAFINALLPMARKVVEEDKVRDPAVLRLLASLEGWDMRDSTVHRFPAARGLRNVLTPYRRSGLSDALGIGGGGVGHLARRAGAAFARSGITPRSKAEREYLVNWLRSAAQPGPGGDAPPAGEPDGTMVIPYQRAIPLNMPAVDPSLDIKSPPLACHDTATIWSQPGNVYTQIVDLGDPDNSRAVIAPGNSEDGESPFRTAGIDLWVKGTTRPSPLTREKVERLGVTRSTLEVRPYSGPKGSPLFTVTAADGAAQFVQAIPPVAPPPPRQEARPVQGRRPDDPVFQNALRTILRQDASAAEVDAAIADCRERAAGGAALAAELQEAARFAIYLIEESAAGRLKNPYGSPYALRRLQELLKR